MSNNSPQLKKTVRSNHRCWRLMIVAIVLILVLGGFGLYYHISQSSDDEINDTASLNVAAAIDDSTRAVQKIDINTDDGQVQVAENYQSAFDRYYQQVTSANPAEWTGDDISKAQFCLIYADKIGLYQQAQLLIGLLEAARSSGVVSDDQLIVSSDQIKEIQQRITDNGFANPAD